MKTLGDLLKVASEVELRKSDGLGLSAPDAALLWPHIAQAKARRRHAGTASAEPEPGLEAQELEAQELAEVRRQQDGMDSATGP